MTVTAKEITTCSDCGEPSEPHEFYYVSFGPNQGQYCAECEDALSDDQDDQDDN